MDILSKRGRGWKGTVNDKAAPLMVDKDGKRKENRERIVKGGGSADRRE